MRTHPRARRPAPDDGFSFQSYLATVEAKDLGAFGRFLAEDVTLQVNDAEPLRGKASVLAGLARHAAFLRSVDHDVLRIYGTEQAFVLEVLARWRSPGGAPIRMRVVAFTDRDARGLVRSVRVSCDTRRLVAA